MDFQVTMESTVMPVVEYKEGMVKRWSKGGEARNKLMYTNSSSFHLQLEPSFYLRPFLLSRRSLGHSFLLHSNPVHCASRRARPQPHYSQLLKPIVGE